MGYEYKPGNAVKGLEAAEVGHELERIRDKCGELTTKNVVNESRPNDAVFHDNFEWDDPVAAELFREQQARKIVHSVVLVTEDAKPDSPKPQAFISVLIADDEAVRHVYQPAEVVADNPEWREQHISVLKARLRSQRRELAAFTEFSTVVSAIDELTP